MDLKSKKVVIIGAAGYTGEELVRLLSHHPFVQIAGITSREHAGKSLASVFPRFHDLNLHFISPDLDRILDLSDLVFLCLPHGLAAEFAVPLIEAGLTVIDLSADFRLNRPGDYDRFYRMKHPAPQLLPQAIYGLPEKNRELLKTAKLIACPGCYPTSIILPVLPLLQAKIALKDEISVCSMSGVSGAGRKADLSLLFSECNESMRSYSLVNHRHVPEIEQELAKCLPEEIEAPHINFTPHLIPVTRGLLSTIYLDASKPNLSAATIEETLRNSLGHEPFVRVLSHGKLPDTKNVIFTNTCEIGFDYNNQTGKIIMTSAIDNLTKGAAGQAIQCMNIHLDIEETAGLL